MTTTTKNEEKSNTIKAVIFVAFFFGLALVWFFFSSNKGQSSQNNQPGQPVKQDQIVGFNKSDKSIETNGNVEVAVKKILTSGVSSETPVQINSTELTKSPYSSIGKLIKIKGKVYKVEELPATPGMPGNWAEILLLAPNKNSALEVSTINFIYAGDISAINSGDIIMCSGYFTGTFQSQNAMGGAVEGLVLVGNKISRQ